MVDFIIRRLLAIGIVMACMLTSAPLYADDITDSINEALQYYENGEYTDAVDSLNYASQLIQQKKGVALEAFLPEPLSGWSTDDATSKATGAAMFGGGITAERKYRKGKSSIKINIITDSPIMQGMMAMFSNPAFATSEGGKMERIGRQKAVVKFNPKNKQGDIKIIASNRFLVSIEGQNVVKRDLMDYAKAIDFKGMATLP